MLDNRARTIALARERGVIRPRDLSALGIDPSSLRPLIADGTLLRSGRGLYTLADFDVTEAHSLVEAVRTQTNGVVCLLSALSFHGIGTQLPFEVWLAVPFGAYLSTSGSVPMKVTVMRSPAYEAGVETHRLEGIDVQIYGIAKTIADCFKFRNKVGMDVTLEALREALRERRCSRDEIRKYARIDRVEKLIQPYMEVLS